MTVDDSISSIRLPLPPTWRYVITIDPFDNMSSVNQLDDEHDRIVKHYGGKLVFEETRLQLVGHMGEINIPWQKSFLEFDTEEQAALFKITYL